MPLKVLINEESPSIYIISPEGMLDSDTYLEFEKNLEPILSKDLNMLVFDLKGLTYISSMGVSAVLKVKKSAEQRGARFLMANLQPQIKKVFEIIKALPSENIVESVQELDSYLDSIQRKEIKKNKAP